MPTYDWMRDVVDGLEASPAPVCRRCGQTIPNPVVAIRYAEPERDCSAPQRVRWYCSAGCAVTGERETP